MRTPTHVCRACGAPAARWSGRCGRCGEWNSLEAAVPAPTRSNAAPLAVTTLEGALAQDPALLATGVAELDRVLGGGLVAGSATLLFGEPGVGKSTLALAALAGSGVASLLCAAEESAPQVARRARRLGVRDSIDLVATSEAAGVAELVASGRWRLCGVDSVSALGDGLGGAGTLAQVRAAAESLVAAARSSGTAVILVGHVTKDGDLAGPRALEHLVDTVVRVEGDRQGSLRLLRALKHRHGPTGEVGLLEMGPEGLRELPDPGRAFRGPERGVAGVAVAVAAEASRSLLVEVQALVCAPAGAPRRVAHQVSAQRLALLLAVLEARCGVATSGLDVFAATAGGLPATEPGVDLALALAVASAATGRPLHPGTCAVGEIGLAGELRGVAGLERRAREARRLGATRVLVPREGAPAGEGVTGVDTLAEALALAIVPG
jgi:DNA repair protein RadA/Sms